MASLSPPPRTSPISSLRASLRRAGAIGHFSRPPERGRLPAHLPAAYGAEITADGDVGRTRTAPGQGLERGGASRERSAPRRAAPGSLAEIPGAQASAREVGGAMTACDFRAGNGCAEPPRTAPYEFTHEEAVRFVDFVGGIGGLQALLGEGQAPTANLPGALSGHAAAAVGRGTTAAAPPAVEKRQELASRNVGGEKRDQDTPVLEASPAALRSMQPAPGDEAATVVGGPGQKIVEVNVADLADKELASHIKIVAMFTQFEGIFAKGGSKKEMFGDFSREVMKLPRLRFEFARWMQSNRALMFMRTHIGLKLASIRMIKDNVRSMTPSRR